MKKKWKIKQYMRLHTMFSNTTSHERGMGPVGPSRNFIVIFFFKLIWSKDYTHHKIISRFMGKDTSNSLLDHIIYIIYKSMFISQFVCLFI